MISTILLVVGSTICNYLPPDYDGQAVTETGKQEIINKTQCIKEQNIITQYPKKISRDGRTLKIRLNWLLNRKYRDSKFRCEGFASCKRYRALDVFLNRYAYIDVSYGEDYSSLLVDMKNGREYTIGAQPFFSPNKALFAVANADEANFGYLQGIEIWSLGEKSMTPIFKAPAPATIISPVGWRGDNCFEFSDLSIESTSKISTWSIQLKNATWSMIHAACPVKP